MFSSIVNGHRRRGISPLIGTLLLLAITVVGGIAVYVFAGEFFEVTEDVTAAGADTVAIEGYDARDMDDLRTHNGLMLTGVNPSVNPDNQLSDPGDVIVLYVYNKGTDELKINEVEIDGVLHTFDSSTDIQGAAPRVPGDGKFVLTGDDATPMTAKGDSYIQGGERLTLVVRFDDAAGTVHIPDGRDITVITTANGSEFTTAVTLGTRQR